MHISPQHIKDSVGLKNSCVNMNSPINIFFHCHTKVFDSLFAFKFPAKQLHLIRDALELYLRTIFHCKISVISPYPSLYFMQVVLEKSISRGQQLQITSKREGLCKEQHIGKSVYKKRTAEDPKESLAALHLLLLVLQSIHCSLAQTAFNP